MRLGERVDVISPRFRVINDHRDVVTLSGTGWQECACWAHGCTLYWDNLPGNIVRIQHGDNGEAVKDFPADPASEHPQEGGWVTLRLVYAWLAAVHAYEVPPCS